MSKTLLHRKQNVSKWFNENETDVIFTLKSPWMRELPLICHLSLLSSLLECSSDLCLISRNLHPLHPARLLDNVTAKRSLSETELKHNICKCEKPRRPTDTLAQRHLQVNVLIQQRVWRSLRSLSPVQTTYTHSQNTGIIRLHLTTWFSIFRSGMCRCCSKSLSLDVSSFSWMFASRVCWYLVESINPLTCAMSAVPPE